MGLGLDASCASPANLNIGIVFCLFGCSSKAFRGMGLELAGNYGQHQMKRKDMEIFNQTIEIFINM